MRVKTCGPPLHIYIYNDTPDSCIERDSYVTCATGCQWHMVHTHIAVYTLTVEEDPPSDHTHPKPSSARATKPLPPQPNQENRQSKKPPPLPPFKPKQPPVEQGMNYEVPWDMLHQRSRGDQDCMEEDLPADTYESVGALDVEEMNKNPPPIWRRDGGAPMSPPLHSPGTKRWTLERNKTSNPSQSQDDLLKSYPAQLPTCKPRDKDLLIKRPLPPEPKTSQKNLDSIKTKNTTDKREESGFVGRYDRDDRGSQRRAQKPLPPPVKSKPTATAHAVPGVGMGFNLRNDPKFSQKLQERKEIHSGTDAVSAKRGPVTEGEEEDVPQERYEEIMFTASEETESSNSRVRKSAKKRTAKLPTPPPVMMVENEEGYVDARQAQDYLMFESSSDQRRSHSPVNLPWEQLAPGKPPLQPRTASMMRESSSHDTHNGEGLAEPPTSNPPLPPRGTTSKPKLKKPLPSPSGSVTKKHSPNPSHPVPTAAKRHTVARASSQSPEPVASMKRRDSSPNTPPPLPSRDPIRPAAPVPDSNPSVPKRHPPARNNFTRSQSASPPKPDSGIFEAFTFGTLPEDNASTNSIQPQTSLHHRVPTRDHEDSPPPVPRRHPMASGKHTPDIITMSTKSTTSQTSPSPDQNPLPLPPRGCSPLQEGRPSSISPPVPPRVSVDPPAPQRLLTQSNRHVTDDGSSSSPPPVPDRSTSDPGVTQSNSVESHRLPLTRQGHDRNSASPERHVPSYTHKTKPPPPPKPRKPPPAVVPRPKSFTNSHSVSNNPDNTQVGIVKKPKPLPPPKPR